MKFALMFSGLLLCANTFAQVTSAPGDIQMNCSSADQKVSVQWVQNSQNRTKSLVINDRGSLMNVSETQLIFRSGFNAFSFKTDKKNETVRVLIDSGNDSYGAPILDFFIGKYIISDDKLNLTIAQIFLICNFVAE